MTHALSIKDLMSVGAHFGHSTQRRNPKMKPYIHSARANIHIIDLTKTLPMLITALNRIEDVVAKGGRVLFVGTKRQASDVVKEEAERCGQHYVNARWLGGTLTNWPTISESISRMKALEKQFEDETFLQLTKKEQLYLRRDHEKLLRSLGGIRHMGGVPTLLFIVDTNKEHIALAEAKRLKIPTVALVDTNSDPTGITYPIPSNDDALKAIQFYAHMVAEAVLKGLEREAQRARPSEKPAVPTETMKGEKKETTKAEKASAEEPAVEKAKQPAKTDEAVTEKEATRPAATAEEKTAVDALAETETKAVEAKES